MSACLKNGGSLEKSASMANNASTRTTELYDRRFDEVTLDEGERCAYQKGGNKVYLNNEHRKRDLVETSGL